MKERIPIWRKGMRKRPSFRRFVRSHDKILTVVGAQIVFMTFLVREGLREMYKESSVLLETGPKDRSSAPWTGMDGSTQPA